MPARLRDERQNKNVCGKTPIATATPYLLRRLYPIKALERANERPLHPPVESPLFSSAPTSSYLFRRLGLPLLLPFLHGPHAFDAFLLLGHCRLRRRLSGSSLPRVGEILDIFEPLFALQPANSMDGGKRFEECKL